MVMDRWCGHPQQADEEEDAFAKQLQEQPLAFSAASSEDLVQATSRLVLPTLGGATLNVEDFDYSDTSNEKNAPILLFLHGICESAETWAVQHVVAKAKTLGVRVAVLELEGHGLSSCTSKKQNSPNPLCQDLTRMVIHCLDFVRLALSQLAGGDDADTPCSYAICGTSLGGTLAIYTAEILSRIQSHPQGETSSSLLLDDLLPTRQSIPANVLEPLPQNAKFLGVIPITPALGVLQEALPPSWMVSALSLASFAMPSAQPPLTPYEDSSHYNCPTDTNRNFSGHWPLGTSKFLLDLTAKKVPNDISHQRLTLSHIPRVVVLAGERDAMIPIDQIQAFVNQLETPKKSLHVLKRAGHDLLVNQNSFPEALDLIFSIFA